MSRLSHVVRALEGQEKCRERAAIRCVHCGWLWGLMRGEEAILPLRAPWQRQGA